MARDNPNPILPPEDRQPGTDARQLVNELRGDQQTLTFLQTLALQANERERQQVTGNS